MSEALEKVKQKYAKNEAEDAWEDRNFINQVLENLDKEDFIHQDQVLYDYFYDNVKDLDKEDFIEHLEDLYWDKESIDDLLRRKNE